MAITLEPDRIVINFLKNNISDVNTSRSGEWIYPDFPRAESLGDAQFPRIGVTLLSESSEAMGIYDNTQQETISIQIDVVTKKDLLFNVTTTDEALGTMSSSVNTTRLSYGTIPNTITNIKHGGVAFGTVTMVDTDADFGTPAVDEVEWSYSTGRLNFNAADIVSYDGEALTSTSVVALEGKKLCQYLARKIVLTFKNNWRTDETFKGLHNPKKLNNIPIPFDEEYGLFRQTLEYSIGGFNAGEGI